MRPDDRPGTNLPSEPVRPADEVRFTPRASGESDAETLRSEIRRTRGQMGETIQEIERRIDLRELTEQAKDAVKEVTDHAVEQVTERGKEAIKEVTDHAIAGAREAVQDVTGQAKHAAREATIGKVENMVDNVGQTANEARSTIMDVISRNPLATALTGIGLGWLYMSSRSGSRRYQPSGRERYYQSGGGMGSTPYAYGTQRQGTTDEGSGFGIQSTARSAMGRVEETAQDVVEQTRGTVERVGSSAGDLGTDVMATIRENPVPAALAAISLGWLIVNRPSGSGEQYGYQARPYRYQAQGAARRFAGDVQDTASDVTGRAQNVASDVTDRVQGVASDVTGRVQDVASDVTGRVQRTAGEFTNQAQDRLDEWSTGAQAQALRTRYLFEQILYDHPLAVGAVALALGALAGLPLPGTEQEHRLVGQASSQVVERAQSFARETAEKVQTVAGRVADEAQSTAKSEAKSQGLTG